jgi:hypothetical protein
MVSGRMVSFMERVNFFLKTVRIIWGLSLEVLPMVRVDTVIIMVVYMKGK